MKKLLLGLLGLSLWAGLASAAVLQTLMGNANLTVSSVDQRIVTTTAFTASRTVTLVSAGATCIGIAPCPSQLEIIDSGNAVTGAFQLIIAPASGETINGSTSSLTLTAAGARVILIPVTGTNWTAQVLTAALQTESGSVNASYNNFRNVLDNGAMQVQQRGTGTQTCAANAAITAAAYSADRWGCSANVVSGAGRAAAVTNDQPTGFSGAQTLFRTSGALTQPICAWQEIPTARSTTLAGQPIVLSFYAKALAGLSADNSNVINGVIITGTGSDQGFGTMTASPAITPAWTGIATPLNQSQTITTSWVRYTMAPITLGSTVTEIGVGLCFTPTATGAGATDGFEFTGVQLEKGPVATPFEFRPYAVELQEALRYFYKLTETATITPIAPCSAVDTTHTNCLIQYPVPMRTTPTMLFANGFAAPTSTTQATLGACTTLAAAATVASTVGNTLNILVNCTAGTIPAAGIASFLYSNNGTGVIQASADF